MIAFNLPRPGSWGANDHDLDSQRLAGLDPVSYSSGYHEGRANCPAMRSKADRVIARYAATFIIVACIGLVVAPILLSWGSIGLPRYADSECSNNDGRGSLHRFRQERLAALNPGCLEL